ncbi:MAG TPA: class I SAM-dependent methyltransferase [Ktedonobacterales bacterium]|nr:class I SAM-dependent methyltransferase [Ktedonobacterales bacterium]
MSWFVRRWRRVVEERPQAQVATRTAPLAELEAGAKGYIFGESEGEISRLDLQHYMFRWEFGGDFLAPLASPRSILDVACGTGRWAREVARQYPQATVIGFDINHQQLEASLAEGAQSGADYLPENCTFLVGNALEPFNFPDGAFDFVMARATSSFIPVSQWSVVIAQMARVCRPGGWIELRDFGLVRSPHSALNELTVKFANLAAARGIYPGAGPYLGGYLQATGLRNVQVRQAAVRSGGPQRATRGGRLMLADYLALLDRVTPGIAHAGIEQPERWRRLLADARSETALHPDVCYAEVELTAAIGQA